MFHFATKSETLKDQPKFMVFFQSLEVNSTSHIELLLQTFYSGRQANLTEREKAIIRDYATR